MKNWIASFFRIVRDDKGQTQGYPIPWDPARPSLYSVLQPYAEAAEGLPAGGLELPDEDAGDGDGLSWAPGALDGVLGHHAAGDDLQAAQAIHDLLLATLDDPTPNLPRLYQQVADGSVLAFIDPLIERLLARPGLPRARLHALALWLARSSPDRGAVKFALALLGALDSGSQRALFLTFGLHEEFTLYAAVALGCSLAPPERERAWWSLARKVHGWGRIHLVERLAVAPSPEVQDWLLREGYRNAVMVEYLAYPCAVGGNLLAALSGQDVDDGLLDAANELVGALLAGGPARDIHDYADGAEVVLLLLDHLARRPPRALAHLIVAAQVADFIESPHTDWDALHEHGWSEALREEILRRARELCQPERWEALVNQGLDAADDVRFHEAAQAAGLLGIDCWERWLARQREGRSSAWYHLMQSDDPARIAQVLDLARERLDLAAIASGPGTALGLGLAYQAHGDLDFIIQRLGAFPGQGWDLLDTALASPVVRNRNMALNALETWSREDWPAEAVQRLRRAHDLEPVEDLKRRLGELLQPQLVERPAP